MAEIIPVLQTTGARDRDSTGRRSPTTVLFSHISLGGVCSGRRSSLSYPVSRRGSSGILLPSLPFVRPLSYAFGHRMKPIQPTPRHQHPYLPFPVLWLQDFQENQDPQVGRDGLCHWYSNARGDGSSRSPTQEYLGEDRFLCFLIDRCFFDEIALLLSVLRCASLGGRGGAVCTLWPEQIYRLGFLSANRLPRLFSKSAIYPDLESILSQSAEFAVQYILPDSVTRPMDCWFPGDPLGTTVLKALN